MMCGKTAATQVFIYLYIYTYIYIYQVLSQVNNNLFQQIQCHFIDACITKL